MMHVDAKPDPDDFGRKVRQKGLRRLTAKGISLDQPVPLGTKVELYWRKRMDQLYTAYEGYCAYLVIHFERLTGGGTVDHYIAKAKRADMAYEWSNYRLACATMNSRKRDFENVLDSFEAADGWFRLELVTGHIFPNPELAQARQEDIQKTIDRLGLDAGNCREVCVRRFDEYRTGVCSAAFLQKYSRLVWMEVCRQGLLRNEDVMISR